MILRNTILGKTQFFESILCVFRNLMIRPFCKGKGYSEKLIWILPQLNFVCGFQNGFFFGVRVLKGGGFGTPDCGANVDLYTVLSLRVFLE